MRRWGGIWTIVGVLVGTALAFYLILSTLSSHKTTRARSEWARSLGTSGNIDERFPATQATETALELEKIAAALGIDIVPRTTGRRPPAAEPLLDYKNVKKPCSIYLRRQLARTDIDVSLPPDAALRYLDGQEANIAAVRRLLIRSETPRWEQQLDRGVQAPIPNLTGHLDLQNVLVADALVRTARGDHTTANADLAAAWRLNQALWDRPVMITQLVSMTISRKQLGALRQLADPPAVWRNRLRQHDHRQAFMNSLRYEGWYLTTIGAPSHARSDLRESFDIGELGPRIFSGVVRPYVQYCLADVSQKFFERFKRLEAIDVLCDTDLAARHASLEIDLPEWNVAARFAMTDFSGSLNRMARLELDLELTLKLLELQAARKSNAGRWPESLPGIEHSAACPHDRWDYGISPGGTMSIAFSRDIRWPDLRGLRLPTRLER